MRQVSALGFEWQHVVAVLSRHNIKELWLFTANLSHEKVRGAMSELERVAKRMGVSSIRAVEVPTDDVWTCVEKAADAFTASPIVLDLGGGVRSLSLCLFIAAVVASELSGAEIAAVYTSAEDKEAIVHVDMRPLKIVHALKDSRSTTKRRALLEGKVEGRYGGRVLKELEEAGLIEGGKFTKAADAIRRYLTVST